MLNPLLGNTRAGYLYIALTFCLAGCSILPERNGPNGTQLQPNQGEQVTSGQQRPNQQQVIQRFEQKIADHLLASIEPLPTVASRADTAQYAEQLNHILNEQGLRDSLLNSEQKKSLKKLSGELAIANFRLARWQQLNHLSTVPALLNTSDESATYKSLVETLSTQVAAGAAYPTQQKEQMLSLVNELIQPEATDELAAAISTLSANEQRWAQARLAFSLSESDQQLALGRLKTALEHQRTRLKQWRNQSGISDRVYSDPYYDLRQESDPGQIALDLIVLHLQEALLWSSYREPLAIEGVETQPYTLYRYANNQLTLNLEQVLNLPAFELQSLAYEMSAEILAPTAWPEEWRGSAAIGISWHLHDQFKNEQLFSDEAYYGSEVRRLSHLLLAVAELELSLGLITMHELVEQFINVLPLDEQLGRQLLTNWFSSHRSYALAMLLTEDFSSLSQPDLLSLLNTPIPESYSQWRQQLIELQPQRD